MTIELNDTQIAQFHEDGVLIVDNLIDTDTADAIAERYTHLFRGEFETGVKPDEVNWREGESSEDLTRQICNGWKADRAIAHTVLREDIGRACANLAGWPGTRINTDNVLWKPPGARPLGFHQDNSYLDWFTPTELLSCWIALDDTAAEGGTMEVVRGSHKWGKFPMASEFHGPEHFRQEMEASAARLGKTPEIIPIVVPKGGGSFHHGWTWHGSGFNNSPNPRRSLVVHTCSSESRYVPDKLGHGIGSLYGRYRRLGDDTMDENYFPITWTADGRRTDSIDKYLATPSYRPNTPGEQ